VIAASHFLYGTVKCPWVCHGRLKMHTCNMAASGRCKVTRVCVCEANCVCVCVCVCVRCKFPLVTSGLRSCIYRGGFRHGRTGQPPGAALFYKTWGAAGALKKK